MEKIAIIGLGYVGLPLAHHEFENINLNNLSDYQVIYDIKGFLDKNLVDGRL